MPKRTSTYKRINAETLINSICKQTETTAKGPLKRKLKRMKRELKCGGLCRREQLALAKKIQKLEKEIESGGFQRINKERIEKLRAYKPTNEYEEQVRLAMITQDPVVVNTDICVCGGRYRMDPIRSISVCTSCGIRVVHTTEDAEKGATNHRSSKSTSADYDNTTLYVNFINQFSENVQEIPEKIINQLLKHLDDVHTKVTHTKLKPILTKYGFSTWARYDYRISRILNGEPIPVFDRRLLVRLNERFKLIKTAFERTKDRQRKKLPHSVTILKATLGMENRYDLVRMFNNHKGREFFIAEETRIRKCCALIEREGGYGFKWSFKALC